MIQDQFGNPWLVQGADPASKVVNKLKRKHYSWLVLPVELLVTGTYTEVPEVEDVKMRVRLLDCIEELA